MGGIPQEGRQGSVHGGTWPPCSLGTNTPSDRCQVINRLICRHHLHLELTVRAYVCLTPPLGGGGGGGRDQNVEEEEGRKGGSEGREWGKRAYHALTKAFLQGHPSVASQLMVDNTMSKTPFNAWPLQKVIATPALLKGPLP